MTLKSARWNKKRSGTDRKRNKGTVPVYGSRGIVGYHSEALIDGPGIIIGRKGTVGAINWVDNNFYPIDTTFYISNNQSKEYLKWLYYLLSNFHLERLNITTGVPGLNREQAHSVILPVPPFFEQKRIADILTSVDGAIEKTAQVIEKTKELKKGLMQKLFTCGIGHKRFKKTEIGEIPLEWAVVNMKRLSVMMTNGFVGTVTPHYSSDEDAIIYLQGFNVRANKIDLTGVTKVNKEFSKIHTKSILKKNDMLTVQSGHIGTSCVVPKELEGANCHALIITRLKKNIINPHFLAYYLNSGVGLRRINSITVGSTVLHINVKDFKNFKVPCPPIMDQEKIVNILSEVYVKIEEESRGSEKK